MERGKKEVIVADASVIVKWFVDEKHTEQALAMRQSYIDEKVDIACPDLLSYEVLNALRYNPEFGEGQTRIAAEALEKYQLLLYPMQAELGALSIKNSFAYGISLYDSSYVSLAEILEAQFYTADQKMLDKLGKKEHFKHISRFISS